jgi:hypothetical protein
MSPGRDCKGLRSLIIDHQIQAASPARKRARDGSDYSNQGRLRGIC